jgi:hypothetical protein
LDVLFPNAFQEHWKLRTREPSAGKASSSVHDGTFPHEDV